MRNRTQRNPARSFLDDEDSVIIEKARAALGENAEQFFDIALCAPVESWREWMAKYADMDAAQADALRKVLSRKEAQAKYERAVALRDKCVARAMRGQSQAAHCDRGQELFEFVSERAPYTEIPHWFHVQDDAPGLVYAAQQIWTWAEILPSVQALLDMHYIRGVSRSSYLRSGASWNGLAYKPAQRIAIGSDWIDEPTVPSSVILHEIGHAVQEWGSDNGLLADDWYLQPQWGSNAPTASEDGARRDAFEAFAEDFVEIVAGDHVGFARWAPGQCADVDAVLVGLQGARQNPRRR